MVVLCGWYLRFPLEIFSASTLLYGFIIGDLFRWVVSALRVDSSVWVGEVSEVSIGDLFR